MNAIEKNQYLMKLMLVLARDLQAMQGRVRSVRFIREYAAAPENLGVYTLSQMNEAELLALAESVGIKKTPSHAKSDVYLNDLGYSLQSFAAYPPVLIDGATRADFAAVCERLHLAIEPFDEIVHTYWTLREGGIIGEEVGNSDPLSPFRAHKELFLPALSYFLFTGTAKGPSHFPADCVLDFTEPCNMNTWITYEKDEAIELLWDRLAFSIVPLPSSGSEHNATSESGRSWTRLIDGKHAGALYIRATV